MFRRLVSIAALAAAMPLAAQAAEPARAVQTQLPRTARPLHYTISVTPDAAKLAFTATARIEIELLEKTDTITFNALDLAIGNAAIAGNGRSDRAAVTIDAASQTARLAFPAALGPGRYSLAIDYSGKINTQASGFFALDFEAAGGRKRALFTQFAPVDARRFMPSWDEPNFRTPFDLSVVVPAGQSAISNMPAARTEPRPGGASLVTFATSTSMSSYLLFLAVGDFDRVTKMAGKTEVGIVAKAGDGAKARFALDETAKVLPWYEEYFGTAYPLPKLDNIAGPGSSQSFAAMENWGAIFTFDNYLLVDPAITTEARRQLIAGVLTHETAHQWFGNLVTMAWWDDIWLNESFASWITTKATQAIHPEWEPLLGLVKTRERAMALDSVATTHAVIRPVNSVDEMNQLFDVITYQKGEAVLTMLEDYVGAEPWRQGVRDYIAANRLSNTTTADLWSRIEAASRVPVSAVARDFTLQPGIPLIRVESATCTNGATLARLSQSEFSRDRPDKAPLAWRVPVIASAGGETARTLVEGKAASIRVPGCGPLVVNRGQTGYYRTLYAPALRAGIERGYRDLEAVDQIGILADNWALGLAGYQPASSALALVDAIAPDANPLLWSGAADILADLHRYYRGDERRQQQLARYASARLSPVLARIGWDARPGERDNDAILRADLIAALGAVGDPAVAAEARRRFAAGDPSIKAGPLRSTLLGVVAANVDAQGWDSLQALAKAETSPPVRLQLYQLLGATRDETLARRALELALTEEPGATNSAAIIAAVASEHPDLAYGFAVEHRDAVEAKVDIVGRQTFIPSLATGSSDPAIVARLQDYAGRYLEPASRGPVDIAIASVEDRVRIRNARLPDISRWLDARAERAGSAALSR